jgi:uncharacterized membrane protein YhaH (DUF805 family)
MQPDDKGTKMQDSVVGGNVHTGNVIHNHYHGTPPVQETTYQPPPQAVVVSQPAAQATYVAASPFAANTIMVGAGRPLQMMSFGNAITTCFSKSFDVEGRASRSEFWWFSLFAFGYNLVTSFFAGFIAVMVGNDWETIELISNMLGLVFYLPIVPASICVTARRLHDIGHSGWYQLIILIPCVGIIMYLVWTLTEGDTIPNVYGPVPTNV